MLLKINPDKPEGRKIRQVVEILQKGGVIIYPTDTVYALGCDIERKEAVDRICKLRGLDPTKANLTFICEDISQVSDYAQQIDTPHFKLMKKNLPGPFTFILKANNKVPRMFRNRKRTIGIRIPKQEIPLSIVRELGRPILSTSLRNDDEVLEYFTDPNDIYEDFKKLVDVVIDGGNCGSTPSTVVDMTDATPVIIREGAAELDE